MTFDFRTQDVCSEIKQKRGVFYSGKPCKADPSVGTGFYQQFELVMTEGLEARTKLPLHSLGARCSPALQLIRRKDTLLCLLPRAGLEETFCDDMKQLGPQGGCGETESVGCIASNQSEWFLDWNKF